VIDYPMIDAGRSRRERNGEIIDLNLERAARSQDFETRLFAQFEKDQRAKDRPLEALFVSRARRRSLEAKRLRARFRERRDDVRSRERAEAALARAWLAQRHAPEVENLRKRHVTERDELARQHGAFFSRFVSILDITGGTRRRRDADRKALRRRQRAERLALAERIRQARETHRKAVEARYAVQLAEVAQARGKALQSLTERHRREEAEEDKALQQREAEREQARQEVEARLAEWKRGLKAAAAREKAHGKGAPPPPPEPPVNKWEPGKKAPRRTKRTNTRRPPARPPDDQPTL
jgi:hypothetical protein